MEKGLQGEFVALNTPIWLTMFPTFLEIPGSQDNGVTGYVLMDTLTL